METCSLSPGLTDVARCVCELGERDDAFGLQPISRNTESPVTATTVPSSPLARFGLRWEWACSYCEGCRRKTRRVRCVVWDSGPVARSRSMHAWVGHETLLFHCGIIPTGISSSARTVRCARWIRLVRPQDLVWVLLFGGHGRHQRHADVFGVALLVALAARADRWSPRLPFLSPPRGKVLWIRAQAGAGLPADRLHRRLQQPLSGCCCCCRWSRRPPSRACWGRCCSRLLACGCLSLLPAVRRLDQFVLEPAEIDGLILRVIFLAMAGNLANALAEELRVQSDKYRRSGRTTGRGQPEPAGAEEAVRRSDRLAALGPALGRPGARAAQSAGHHQGVGRDAHAQRQRRKTRWRAKWPASSPPKWTAPTPWSRASWISRGR